ncbi:MAG: phosphotransferase [Propionibacteriales bacterium]|nr:phosphotransferase [Propionibacteriales bacterium]
MMGGLHDDEIAIDLALVRALVDRALPDCAGLPLHPLSASGSTNALFRLGDELLVRLPRQPGGSATIEKEARWLSWVAPHLPVPVPEVVAVGEPDLGYPERWSVVRWIAGDVPSAVQPGAPFDFNRGQLALDLADVITALRSIDVPATALDDPALRWYRGEPLATMDEHTRQGIEACRRIPDLALDLDAVLAAWDDDTAWNRPSDDAAVVPRRPAR